MYSITSSDAESYIRISKSKIIWIPAFHSFAYIDWFFIFKIYFLLSSQSPSFSIYFGL